MALSTADVKARDAKELLAELKSSPEGLSQKEASERLQQYGYNEIPEKKRHLIFKLLGYLWGPIPWMIEAAAILSAIIGHWNDFWIILLLLLLNVVVGFWEEYKAGNAIEMLKSRLALVARVRRGNWAEVPARELVPGDIIRVRLGDIIPADIKLISGGVLLADESALTGESLPVEKHVQDISYSGSVVRKGEMDGLVVFTGMNSFFGKTAELVGKAKSVSHFQKAVVKIGDYLILMAFILVGITFIASVLRGEDILAFMKFALVLVVAAIPAALPVVLSVTLAAGAIALAKKEAIVSKLVSIEEMAGMDVLCTDKTGTITQNRLSVAEAKPYGAFSSTELLSYAVLSSREEDDDPIDNSIIKKGKADRDVMEAASEFKVLSFTPFDPVNKRTKCTVKNGHGSFDISKGAPQVILSMVSDKDLSITKEVEEFAKKGYRSIAVATNAKGKWQYAGLIALHDPPREDSKKTIETAESMGISVKMVTGDNIAIAKQIARLVGLGTNILTSKSIDKPDLVLENIDGFAEVFPEHKYGIVKRLQAGGHIVGMTGDGVNDAPALKQADVGIAVAGSTDAAKSAAEIVLTNPGLSVIVDAMKESRKTFQRMTNYAIYRIAETIRALLFITLSILAFNFYPVTAFMIVLLALLNDTPIMTIAYDNVHISGKPEKWNMRRVLGMATYLGALGLCASFLLFYIGLNILHLSTEVLQSFIFLKLAVAGHLTMLSARTRSYFWTIRPATILAAAVIITQTIATIIVVYGFFVSAIGWGLAAFVWGYAIVSFFIADVLKVQIYKRMDSSPWFKGK
jgi:H+-transporting ATPase